MNETITWFDWADDQPNNYDHDQMCLTLREYHDPFFPIVSYVANIVTPPHRPATTSGTMRPVTGRLTSFVKTDVQSSEEKKKISTEINTNFKFYQVCFAYLTPVSFSVHR